LQRQGRFSRRHGAVGKGEFRHNAPRGRPTISLGTSGGPLET
jgi:hypothetical protein